MRRFIAVAALCVSLPFAMGSSCNGNNDCPDDTEASSISMSHKPTCKPNSGPKWVPPSPTAKL